MPKSKSHPQQKSEPTGPRYLCEAEVVTGLKDYAAAELRARFGDRLTLLDKARDEEIPFQFDGSLPDLSALTKTAAVYLVQHYAVPRPQALLGHQHFTQLLKMISTVRSMHPAGTFRTFRIAAAGSHSSVFQRIKEEIAKATGMTPNDEEGDLMLRVRKADIHRDGWEVLVRLTPRPLAARAWRMCNMEGALNATIASAMIEMSDPRPDDRVFNLLCGSGTLLIERLLRAPAAVIGGCDHDPIALRCATDNLMAAGFVKEVDLFEMDVADLPLPDACIDVVCGDLPWGQLVGSHEANARLYPLVLREAARITVPGGRAVLITHEIRLMEQVLRDCAEVWSLRQEVKVFQGGLHPRIYLLDRR
ncbi:MAG: methyltransferase domain-containing protein [Anaerolineae bacterium]|nr:methyltransferase domain-containing protein [Anaerolineae bacterium]